MLFHISKLNSWPNNSPEWQRIGAIRILNGPQLKGGIIPRGAILPS